MFIIPDIIERQLRYRHDSMLFTMRSGVRHGQRPTNDSNSWTISPSHTLYRFWELLGIILTLSLLIDVYIISLHRNVLHFTHPLTDLYFLIDIIIRFHTEYVDDITGEVVRDLKKIQYRYLTSWFFIDLVLSIPFGFIRYYWEERPVVRLLEVRENRIKSLGKFFISRSFRKSI